MGLIADILLAAGALGAALYCYILSRRLARFNDLEQGVGGAVAILSVQVDDMTKTLRRTQTTATSSTALLEKLTGRAEDAARRLELLVASMHDLPEPPEPVREPAPQNKPRQQPPPKAGTANVHPATRTAEPDVLFLRHRIQAKEAAE